MSPSGQHAVYPVDYDLLERQVGSLLEGERDFIANAANFAAFLFHELPAVNWAGFYFPDEDGLVLGPFGGKPACTRLPEGRGVCGAAFAQARGVIVDDVAAVADHIACDSASRSELVVPLLLDGRAVGVFDVDSPVVGRFAPADLNGLERLTARFVGLVSVPERYRRSQAAATHLNERIDIQTCRDHHVVIRYLADQLGAAGATDAALPLLKRLRAVLVTHLKLEDDWLYPNLAKSDNEFVRRKAERYGREMGGLRDHFHALWQTWQKDGAIGESAPVWLREWAIFQRALVARIANEDHDLYMAAEADFGV
ncbi:MAG TPA: GAF domain-containing protein [Candidatus Baltobacteraceae bacterium]|jgi:GAF domain-containing protein